MSESVQQEEIKQKDPTQETNDELEQLRREIARQIRSNQRFLDNFFNEDFQEEETD